MKVLFFGTPPLTIPTLDFLIQHHTVVGVVCRPDTPQGRGYELKEPLPKVTAKKHNIPVFQPQGPWTEETIQALTALEADIGIVVAYGRILPERVYKAPRLGSLNIHYSLLPRLRGAGPMQWSLINGDKETGASVFWLVNEMDAGPIFHQESVPITDDDDAFTLKEKLIPAGVLALAKVLSHVEKDHLIKEPQKGTPTFAPLLKKEDGHLDWAKSATELHNRIRGVREWPVAFTSYTKDGKAKGIKILTSHVSSGAHPKSKNPGAVLHAAKEGLLVQTGEGQLLVTDVHPEGSKAMKAWDFWQGAHLNIGDLFV